MPVSEQSRRMLDAEYDVVGGGRQVKRIGGLAKIDQR